ncbi:MAG: helix-turn-helix transcriptional regulator [Candidatus Izemoplasmatales bacterium]|nr:helix-turn-helix transcriptional regulator [Candidatus Izemoplasmatales bacterium]
MMTENDIKERIAFNLIRYRKKNNMTQLELAVKLNYSDKSISKWERKEGLPDLVILQNLADLFGITLNDMLSLDKKMAKPKTRLSRLLVAMIAFTGVWTIATLIYVAFGMFVPDLSRPWLSFIYAIPVSITTSVVFSSLWGNLLTRFASISALSWSLVLALYITLDNHAYWLLFIAAVPLQVLIILAFTLKRKQKDI